MKCFVCGGDMDDFCEKHFGFHSLENSQYVKCRSCGMVISKTLYEMPREKWVEINEEAHKRYQGSEENIRDPRWIDRLKAQRDVLISLYEKGILFPNMKCVDYGCGDGKLADYVNGASLKGLRMEKYDKYMRETLSPPDYLSDEELEKQKWELLLDCSVLEHLKGREELDRLMGLIEGEHGIHGMHTLVCEEVPGDPDWFYYLPGHCTFYTNKAMSLVFEEYGFRGCAYHPQSRLWFCFKDPEVMEHLREKQKTGYEEWVFSYSFVDYWKQKPYR